MSNEMRARSSKHRHLYLVPYLRGKNILFSVFFTSLCIVLFQRPAGALDFGCSCNPQGPKVEIWHKLPNSEQSEAGLKITGILSHLWWLRRARIHLLSRRPGFNPWVWKIPWRGGNGHPL